MKRSSPMLRNEGPPVRYVSPERSSYATKQVSTSVPAAYDPLHRAVEQDSVALVEELIKQDSDANVKHQSTPLHLAAQLGNLKRAQALVKAGANLEAQDETGKMPIHTAIESGQTEIVKWLLSCGNYSNLTSGSGLTPLAFAVRSNRNELIEVLVNKGADVNEIMDELGGITPLHYAVQTSDIEMVQQLMADKADTSVCCSKTQESPVHLAAKLGYLHVLRIFFFHGADLSRRSENSRGHAPIHEASEGGHAEVVEWLISKEISVNCTSGCGYTALQIASRNNHLAVVNVLLNCGADVRTTSDNSERSTALYMAIPKGDVSLISRLIQAGADIHIEEATTNHTPLHRAVVHDRLDCLMKLVGSGGDIKINVGNSYRETLLVTAAVNNRAAVASWLVEGGVPVDSKGEGGLTALDYAVSCGNINVLQVLIDKGADVNSKDENLATPLHSAVFRGRTEITKLLLRSNARILDYAVDGANAVHFAAMAGHLSCFELLLDDIHLASLPTRNTQRDSALHIAAARGFENIVQWLIDKGMSPNVVNNFGVTPLIIASFEGRQSVAKLLLDGGSSVNAKAVKWDDVTALHAACSSGRVELVQLLVERGAELNARTRKYKYTPLHLAVKRNSLDITNVLLIRGANVTFRDSGGLTAKQLSEAVGYDDIAQAFATFMQQ